MNGMRKSKKLIEKGDAMKIAIMEHKKLRNKMSTWVQVLPYENEGLKLIYSFRRSYYHRDENLWELPIEAFKIIVSNSRGDLQIIGELPIEMEEYLDLLDIYEKPDLDYSSKTTPFKHQEQSFKYALNHNKFLLGDEQGLGKTKQALDIACSHKHKMQYCLIVCGVNGLKYNWQNEIKVYTEE